MGVDVVDLVYVVGEQCIDVCGFVGDVEEFDFVQVGQVGFLVIFVVYVDGVYIWGEFFEFEGVGFVGGVEVGGVVVDDEELCGC